MSLRQNEDLWAPVTQVTCEARQAPADFAWGRPVYLFGFTLRLLTVMGNHIQGFANQESGGLLPSVESRGAALIPKLITETTNGGAEISLDIYN